jgi:hypothetical protein
LAWLNWALEMASPQGAMVSCEALLA